MTAASRLSWVLSRPGLRAWAPLAACGLLASSLAWAGPARVIVQFKTTTQAAAVSGQAGQDGRRASWLGAQLGRTLQDGRVIDPHRQVVFGAEGEDAEALAARLSQESSVALAVPDRLRHASDYPATAPNDSYYAINSSRSSAPNGQWYLAAPTSTFVSAINAQPAWALSTGATVVVKNVVGGGGVGSQPLPASAPGVPGVRTTALQSALHTGANELLVVVEDLPRGSWPNSSAQTIHRRIEKLSHC